MPVSSPARRLIISGGLAVGLSLALGVSAGAQGGAGIPAFQAQRSWTTH